MVVTSPELDKMPEILDPGIRFFEHQKSGIARMWNMNSFLLADDMGLGKAESVSEPVLTPSGWSTMGQVKVGDRVVSVDGTPATVMGVFPQGVREIVKVTFSDGSWVKCDWDHLWEVNTPVRKKRGNPPLVKTTRELVDSGLHDGAANRKWFIPMVAPVEFEGDEPEILDPYTLGVLLGDGCLTQSSITLGTDFEIIQGLVLPQGVSVASVRRPGPNYYASCRLRGILPTLRALGLHGARSETKSIPEEYLYSTSAVRIALLQGILDTDGTAVSSRGGRSTSIEYGTVSKRLAEQVKFIVQSLGGTASIQEKVPTYTYRDERRQGQVFYRMVLHLPTAITPFRLARKLENWIPRTKYEPTRSIESVEVVGEEDAVCIRVDHPRHLYVTRNCIVTHNTMQTLAVCAVHAHLTKRLRGTDTAVLVVCPPSLKRNWFNETSRFTRFAPTVLDGAPKKRVKQIDDFIAQPGHKVLICNYEQIGKHLSHLNSVGFSIVVADEAHYVKNPQSLRTQAFQRLNIKRKFMLTGTPMQKSVEDLWVLLDQVQPGQWGTFWGFCQRFCNTPDAPIWMADGTFKPLGDIKVGDKVMGWQDPEEGRTARRTIVESEVLDVRSRVAPSVLEVTMPSGQVIKCTPDHQWLSGSHGGTGDDWVNIYNKNGGNRLNTLSRVVMPVEPLPPEKQRLMDWLCGMIDGEGSGAYISQSESHNPKIHARIGEVLDELGIKYTARPMGYFMLGGRQFYANMATWTKGVLQKDEWIQDCLFHGGGYSRTSRRGQLNRTKEKPVSAKDIGPGEVMSMQTSTGNYVAWGLASKNCVYGGFEGKAVVGVKNEAQLTENLNRVMIRRLSKDVLDLPEVQFIRREVDLGTEQLKLYNRAVKDMILEREDGEDGEEEISTPMVRFLRLSQICTTTATVREDGKDYSAKFDAAMIDLEDLLDAGRKVVVFTKFRDALGAYHRRIAKAHPGVPVYELHGEVPIADRQSVVDSWSAQPGAAVILCMIQVAGVGLNMTSSSDVQFLDKDVTPANNAQAVARVHRIGQGGHVRVYEYHARGTIEARIDAILASKSKTADQVVENKSLQALLNEALDEER